MTASRPARAMRGAAVIAALAIAWRIPAMRHEFAAALAAAGGRAQPTENRTAMPRLNPRIAVPWQPTERLVVARPAHGEATPPPVAVAQLEAPHPLNRHPHYSGDPSRAERREVASRLHGDDGGGSSADLAAAISRPSPRLVSASPAAVAPAPAAFDLATAAYARLAAGDRRGAVRLFDAALVIDPRNAPWRVQRDALTRHWSASAHSIVRAGGSVDTAVTPVLGGGQSGGGIAYTLDPLAARPLAVTLRGSIAHDDGGRTAFAAVGVQWRPLPGVTVAAERLIGVGPAARDEWTARVALGSDRRLRRLRLTSYAEGGIIDTAGYVAGQARIGPEFVSKGVAIVPGVGGWASVQRDGGRTVDRLDLGPGVTARRGPLAVAVDYRIRVAGNAAPGSGPVLTLSAAF